jgi:hypothetical protein
LVGAEIQMKYQQIIMAQRVGPQDTEFRQFYVPVEDRDGRWLPCGKMREEHVSPGAMLTGVSEYECGGNDTCGPLEDIPAIEGWKVVARLWLPDDYVPPSAEVLEEGLRRAREYLAKMWRTND